MHVFVCFWVIDLILSTTLSSSLSSSTSQSQRISLTKYDCGLIKVLIQGLSFDCTKMNIAGLCWFTGGPWECPQSCSCPLAAEHTTCHHEAYRRTTGLLTATDSGTTHKNMLIYLESHVVFKAHIKTLSVFVSGSHFLSSFIYSSVFWWPNSGVMRYCLSSDVYPSLSWIVWINLMPFPQL